MDLTSSITPHTLAIPNEVLLAFILTPIALSFVALGWCLSGPEPRGSKSDRLQAQESTIWSVATARVAHAAEPYSNAEGLESMKSPKALGPDPATVPTSFLGNITRTALNWAMHACQLRLWQQQAEETWKEQDDARVPYPDTKEDLEYGAQLVDYDFLQEQIDVDPVLCLKELKRLEKLLNRDPGLVIKRAVSAPY